MAINLNCLTLENGNYNNFLESSVVEETYFYSTLSFINEYKDEVTDSQKELYKSLLESNTPIAVNESFSKFFSRIGSAIDKFLKFIKSLFDRFIITINKFVKSDKYIKKHKKQLYLFTDQDEFEFKGYQFTFDEAIPVIEALAEYTSDFVDIRDSDIINGDTRALANALADKRAKLMAQLDGAYYDELRARILGKDGNPISSSDFSSELFATFRGGDTEAQTLTATKELVINSLISFENFDKNLKEVKKLKEQIEKDYNAIKKDIENMVYRNKDNNLGKTTYVFDDKYDGIKGKDIIVDPSIMTQIDLFLKVKAQQVDKMSSLHSLAFSAKIDALNACAKQDKNILYTALSVIEKNHYKD